jgi:hypothetical protein
MLPIPPQSLGCFAYSGVPDIQMVAEYSWSALAILAAI